MSQTNEALYEATVGKLDVEGGYVEGNTQYI